LIDLELSAHIVASGRAAMEGKARFIFSIIVTARRTTARVVVRRDGAA
jgi:hypothetical protein